MTTETKSEPLAATITKTMKEGQMTQLAPNRLMHAEHAHSTFVAAPETGTPPEAVLAPHYWAHYAVNANLAMKPGDHILVKPEDGTYFSELLVRSVSRAGVNVVELRRVVFDKGDDKTVGDFGDYLVKWQGPRLKWVVIRKADNRRLVDSHETQDAAIDWLRQHQRVAA